MAYTTAQLDTIIATLETALGSGAAEVMFDGRRIVYKSQDEIFKGIGYFKSLRPASVAGAAKPVRQIRLTGSKGL